MDKWLAESGWEDGGVGLDVGGASELEGFRARPVFNVGTVD